MSDPERSAKEMKFSIWHFCTKFSFLLFIGAAIAIYPGEKTKSIELYGEISLILLILLCLTGAILGILMSLGKLKMKCPFCSSYGQVYGNKKEGMWMRCPKCGLIHGTGLLKLKLKAEPAGLGNVASRRA